MLNLNYRFEAAEKLGFENYGELALVTKMAPSIEAIENTLVSILDKGIHVFNLILKYISNFVVQIKHFKITFRLEH